MDTTPRVYSYLRFSTPEQAMGDSERRQIDRVRRYAAGCGLPFDERAVIADRGLSGFRGAHRKRGHLGRFLELVRKGEVPKGSILVVENIDRLGREEMLDALEVILFQLLRRGISLQTLYPDRLYTAKTLDKEISELVREVGRAHAESKRKSDMLSDAWRSKRELLRETGQPMTSVCPTWLLPVRDEHGKVTSFREQPLATRVIRSIFEMKLRGLGKARISKKLNAEGKWFPPKRNTWRPSFVQKILESRTVLGEYQPHERVEGKRVPVGDAVKLYPQIVAPAIFERVQRLLRQNKGKGKGGRVSKANNLFRGIAKCAYCHGPIAVQPKGPGNRTKMRCERAARGAGCVGVNLDYQEFEDTVLDNCHSLRPELILPDDTAQKTKLEEAQAHLREIAAQVQDIDSRLSRVTEETVAPDVPDARRARLRTLGDELDAKKAALQKAREDAASEVARLSRDAQSVARWVRDLDALRRSIGTRNDHGVEQRIHLQAHLRELIDVIEVFTAGFREEGRAEPTTVHPLPKKATAADRAQWREAKRKRLRSVETIEWQIRELDHGLSTQRLRRFIAFVKTRRMSKEGRFYRVHFTTGSVVDLVPSGSLADGLRLVKTGGAREWEWIRPNLDTLLADFEGAAR